MSSEDVSEVSKTSSKTRKSFTREFKLRAITMVHGNRVDTKQGTHWNKM